MKKLFTLSFLALLVFASNITFGQCTVNNANTTPGFTPNNGTITQNAAYALTVQLYAPTTQNITTPITATVTVDSVHIASISGVPSGITYSFDAANIDGGGMTVDGGHNAAICFAGTTSAPVGTDSLTFNGNAYITIPGLGAETVPLSQLKSVFSLVFTVQAPSVQSSCDTIVSVPLTGPFVSYTWQAPGVGYISGSGAIADQNGNKYPALAVGEGFKGAIGDSVTSVDLGFANTVIKTTDSLSTVKVYIYDNTGTSGVFGNTGAPGNRIDSTTITLKQAAASATLGQLLPVHFAAAPVLTTSSFFVVIATPTTTGDTLVLLTDTIGAASGNGWADYGNGAGWASYDSLLGGTLGNLVAVTICGATTVPPTAAYNASATSGCAPLTVTFTDISSSLPTSWSWNFGDGSAAATTQNPTHTFTTAGTYNVVETATNSGGNSTSTQTITVSSGPTATNSTVNATTSTATNGSAVVTATGTSPFTYAWSAGSSTNDSLKGVAAGTYYVTITDANTCHSIDTVVISFNNGILNLSNAATVKIYPNPATDVLNLVWSASINAEVSIIDLNGKVINTVITNGEMKTAFDIHSLATGTYLVRVTDKNTNEQQSMMFSKF